MAEERVAGMPKSALGIIMLILLVIAVLAYVAPDVLHPLFLGILMFGILAIYALTQYLVSRGIVPEEYVYLVPVTVFGFAFLLAGLAQKGYLPMASVGSAVLDTISTTMIYAILIVMIAGVIAYLVYPRKK